MALLFTLPPELLQVVFSYLDRLDHKRCRRVSHVCANWVTPLVFSEAACETRNSVAMFEPSASSAEVA